MSAASYINQIQNQFPVKLQSPNLYLQAAGSTGADGSTAGIHLRWDLLDELGAMHLPKGDFSQNNHHFNRPQDDYVYLLRSAYIQKYPTVIDLVNDMPIVIHPLNPVWIYKDAIYQHRVYLRFLDSQRYQDTVAQADPQQSPIQFLALYGDGLLEFEVMDHLGFAAQLYMVTNKATVAQVEGISVSENVPFSDSFVSVRKTFHETELCASGAVEVNAANLLANPNFEEGNTGFETDFIEGQIAAPGRYSIVEDAQDMDSSWIGQATEGAWFMALSTYGVPEHLVWAQTVEVETGQTYCFSGATSLLSGSDTAHFKIRILSMSGNILTETDIYIPNIVNAWYPFEMSWDNHEESSVQLQILDVEVGGASKGVGLDQLYFGKCLLGRCLARIENENLKGIRFRTNSGFVRAFAFETYSAYLNGVVNDDSVSQASINVLDPAQRWKHVDQFALNLDTQTVLKQRLDQNSWNVHNRWPRFNDGDHVNIPNYEDKWSKGGGLRDGVQSYLQLSEAQDNPRAVEILTNDTNPDDQLSSSYLDLLRIAAFDFHVARMLGLGHIDVEGQSDLRYIYLAHYLTEGMFEGEEEAITRSHMYMSVPTGRSEQRLPKAAELLQPVYGLFVNNGTNEGRNIVDKEGYTPDGLQRYVNFKVRQPIDNPILPQPFYQPGTEFNSLDHTPSVFMGLESRMQGQANWQRPELAHDESYFSAGVDPVAETQPIAFPANEQIIAYTHKQTQSGTYQYAAYGINWFSRASAVSQVVRNVHTLIQPANTLLPPTNLQVQLIQEENPLLLTTAAEQSRLRDIVQGDKSLLRVSFDYHHMQDGAYAFGNRAEFFFRPDPPLSTNGAIKSAQVYAGNSAIWEVRTQAFVPTSEQDPNAPASPMMPQIAAADQNRFAGGVFVKENKRYIIQEVRTSNVAHEGPIFLLQRPLETSPQPDRTGGYIAADGWERRFDIPDNPQFLALENMAEASNWGGGNPLRLQVQLGHSSWTTQEEYYVIEGQSKKIRLRGVRDQATVTAMLDGQNQPTGVYRINFMVYKLSHHPQYSATSESVDWYKGVVRIHKAGQTSDLRKTLEVLQINHLGEEEKLELVVVDSGFPTDPILTGPNISVNFYPGYRAYLYADSLRGFTAAQLMPPPDEDSKISFLGMRALDIDRNYRSKVGLPQTVVAQALIEPRRPEQPLGADFASRPDADGRSSYSFQLQLQHQPFAIAFYRANEDRLLRALFKASTVDQIYADLKSMQNQEGGDPMWVNRWQNLIGLDYRNTNDPDNPAGAFKKYPAQTGYRFPKPDRGPVFDGIREPGHASIKDKVVEAIENAFVPLTEQPLFYRYIKGGNYLPKPTPQTIRDRNGKVMMPDHPDFDQAPMARRSGNNRVLFTDFTLDGAARDLYFYAAREIGSRMKMGDLSPISGPIRLINTSPPEAPVIKQLRSIEADPLLNTGPVVEFVFNPYPVTENIRRFKLYRSLQAVDALTPRAMQLVKTIEIPEGHSGPIQVVDDFEQAAEYPYGESLFYRAVAERAVEMPNASGTIETAYIPSRVSNTMLSTIIDSLNPKAPQLQVSIGNSTPTEHQLVALSWNKTAYKGTYRLYKMNRQAQWVELTKIQSNDPVIQYQVPHVLERVDAAGQAVYHHFKVMAENASGLTSLEERIFTLD